MVLTVTAILHCSQEERVREIKKAPKVKYCITSLMCIICKKVELKQQSMELDIGRRGGGEEVQRPLHCKVGKFWRPYHTEYDYR